MSEQLPKTVWLHGSLKAISVDKPQDDPGAWFEVELPKSAASNLTEKCPDCGLYPDPSGYYTGGCQCESPWRNLEAVVTEVTEQIRNHVAKNRYVAASRAARWASILEQAVRENRSKSFEWHDISEKEADRLLKEKKTAWQSGLQFAKAYAPPSNDDPPNVNEALEELYNAVDALPNFAKRAIIAKVILLAGEIAQHQMKK